MRYNGVIECKFISEPDEPNDIWFANVTLITNHLSLDDLHPLQYYFACYENNCLRISEDEIQIGPLPSLDHLITICHEFSIYLRNIVKLKKIYGEHPVYWSLEEIMEWRILSRQKVSRQAI